MAAVVAGTPSVAPRDDPSTTSADYNAMISAWEMIDDILAGAEQVRSKGVRYLPQFQKEPTGAYNLRRACAPWRPEFEDALRSLCSKPFTKVVTLNPEAPEQLLGKVADEKTKKRSGGLVDNIDGQGNSLHVFARDTFQNGVARGLEAIYVTFPDADPARTRAEEKASGVRPYWVHVRANDIIDLKLKVIAGRTVVSHIRIRECTREPDGFAEIEVERVRVVELDELNRPVWRLYRKGTDAKYVEDAAGTFFGVKEIPIALFFTAQRSGNYRVKPPLLDIAVMQIELFQALSRKDQILTLTGSPMLVGKGFKPPAATQVKDANGRTIDVPAPQVEVGPGVVLFAPATTEGVQPGWDYIQPNAANIKEVREDVNDIILDFRRLALQPTTPKSGNLVATGQAIDAAKSHSAVEAWANGLADALNQALVYTCQWLKISDTVTAVVHTDFGVDIAGTEESKVLGDAQKRGVVSAQTEREELARRGVLGPQFDEDQEEQRLAEEQQGQELKVGDGIEPQIDPITGKPIGTAPELPSSIQ